MKLSLSTSLSGFTKSAVPFVGALDAFNPDMAWSHRRALVSSFTGNLLQARRMSDDTPYDVPVKADGEGDFDSLLAFLGSESAAVAQLSEQIGGYHMLQGTADLQRIIVDAGSLLTVGGKAASRGLRVPSGTPDHGGTLLTSTFATYSGSVATLFLRGAHDAYSGWFAAIIDVYCSFGKSGSFGSSTAPALYHRNGTGYPGVSGLGDFTGAFDSDYLISVVWDGSTITFRDGTHTYTLSQSGGFDFNQFSIAFYVGGSDYVSDANRIQEVAVWLSDQTANEAAIRSAMMA